MEANRLVSVPELAAYYGVSRSTIYNLINKGMPTVKVGHSRRFRLDQVEAWLDGRYGSEVAA